MPKEPKPRKPGRPKLAKGDAKAAMLRVRLTEDEIKRIGNAAQSSGLSVSEWVRVQIGVGNG